MNRPNFEARGSEGPLHRMVIPARPFHGHEHIRYAMLIRRLPSLASRRRKNALDTHGTGKISEKW